MFYQYGLYKPLVNKKLGSPATIRQFFPLAFVIGLYVGLVLSIFFPVIRYMYISVLLLHIGIGLSIGCNKARKWNRISVVMWMPLIFFIIHYAYGWGYIKGIFKIITKQPFNVESNR